MSCSSSAVRMNIGVKIIIVVFFAITSITIWKQTNISAPLCPDCSPTQQPCPILEPQCPPQECPTQLTSPKSNAVTKRDKPRIIMDSFNFGHELDWLEIRLNEFKDVVDYFAIIEGNITFSGKPKPMYYLDNQERFSAFKDKIIHVNCTSNETYGYFKFEHLSRRCFHDGLKQVQDKLAKQGVTYGEEDFLVFVSDLDELPRTRLINQLRWFDPLPALPAVVSHQFYYYNFYWLQTRREWPGTNIVSLKTIFKDYPTTDWHINVKTHATTFKNGGWHCSSCMSAEQLSYKLKTFSHTEFDKDEFTNTEWLQKCIDEGLTWTKIGDNMITTEHLGDLPLYILKNMDKYPHLIPLSRFSKAEVLEAALKYHEGQLIMNT